MIVYRWEMGEGVVEGEIEGVLKYWSSELDSVGSLCLIILCGQGVLLEATPSHIQRRVYHAPLCRLFSTGYPWLEPVMSEIAC
jgi:hypothetical protein